MASVKIDSLELGRLEREIYGYLVNPVPGNNVFITTLGKLTLTLILKYIPDREAMHCEFLHRETKGGEDVPEYSFTLKYFERYRGDLVSMSPSRLKEFASRLTRRELSNISEALLARITGKDVSTDSKNVAKPQWVCSKREGRYFFHLFLANDDIARTNMEVSEEYVKLMRERIIKLNGIEKKDAKEKPLQDLVN